MKHTRLSLALLVVGLLVVGAACQPRNENGNTNDDGNVNAAVNQNRNVSDDDVDDDVNVNSTVNTNSSDDDEVDDVNTNSNTNSSDDGDDDSSSGAPAGLRISKPEKGETVASPFEVSGRAYASSVTVRILNAAGNEVIAVPVTVRDNEFKVNLSFVFTNTTSGKVVVEDTEGTKSSVDVTFKVGADDSSADDDTNINTSSSDDEDDS